MHVHISFGLPSELLAEIETNIKGKTRNAKLLTCVEKGYSCIMSSQPEPASEGNGQTR